MDEWSIFGAIACTIVLGGACQLPSNPHSTHKKMNTSDTIIDVMKKMSGSTTKKIPREKVLAAALDAGVGSKQLFFSACATLDAQGLIGYTTSHAAARSARTWLTEKVFLEKDVQHPQHEPQEWTCPPWAKWEIARAEGEDHKRHPSLRGGERVKHGAPHCALVSNRPMDSHLREAA